MTQSEIYMKQAAGIYALLAWVKECEQSGTPCIVSNQTIFLNDLISRFFCLGFNKASRNPYIALQHEESHWFKLITWDSIFTRNKDSNIYFVSKKIDGDDLNCADIPSFAVAIRVDSKEIVNIMNQFKKIELRSYSLINKKPIVNFHNSISLIPIKKIELNDTYLIGSEKYKSYNDLMSISESKLRDKYVDIPTFLGDESEAKSNFDTFWKPLTDKLSELNKSKKK